MKIEEIINIYKDLGVQTLGYEHDLHSDLTISGISFDSRKVLKGNAFFAISGYREDGSRFIPDAIKNGASLVILEDTSPPDITLEVPFIYVSNIRLALSRLTGIQYGKPSASLSCIGITGTNGKTSTAWIVAQLLGENSACSTYIGTLGAYSFEGEVQKKLLDEGRTTFDPITYQELLSNILKNGSTSAVVEVTSHGLEQYRTATTEWDVAAFSNLTQDHLDHHSSMETYGAIKSLLFFRELKESSKKNRTAVINIDDPFGYSLALRIKKELPEVSLVRVSERTKDSELYLKKISQAPQSTTFTFAYTGTDYTLTTKFLGSFYITNMLLAIGISMACGKKPEDILKKAPHLKAVPGRLQLVTEHYPRVFVDYAHTPDALDKVQRVLLEFLEDEAQRTSALRGRLITVFGCGGDRDKTKRPLMGEVVSELSDVAVITSDNPRTEDPELIIEDIMPGINSVRMKKDIEYYSITDRHDAIEFSLKHARKNDIVLIAGKGHEDYQEIHGIKYPFDDVVVVRELFSELL